MDSSESNKIIAELAEMVKETYCTLRKRVMRIDSFTPGPKYDKIWLTAGEMCAKYAIDPQEYIEVQFYALKPFPEINQIHTQRALQRFEENRKNCEESLRSDIVIQLQSLQSMVKAGHDLEETLTDPKQGFDPLFIYVSAIDMGLPDIAKAYFRSALIQYITSVYYDKLYGTMIDDRLRNAAASIRKGLADG